MYEISPLSSEDGKVKESFAWRICPGFTTLAGTVYIKLPKSISSSAQHYSEWAVVAV